MSDHPTVPDRKPLSPAAQRALAEAEARRQAAAAHAGGGAEGVAGAKGARAHPLW